MKNTTLTLCLSAALMAGFATQGLAAGEHKGGPRHSFEELDANSDGQISPEEINQHKAERFAKADANGDGELTKEEITARFDEKQGERRARFVEKMFKHRDADNSGTISLAEMQSGGKADRMFKKGDANGDGLISAEEFEAIQAHRQGKKAE